MLYEVTGLQIDTNYRFEVNIICADGSYGDVSAKYYSTCNYIGDFEITQFNTQYCWFKSPSFTNDVSFNTNSLSFRENPPEHRQFLYAISPNLIDLPNQNHRLRMFVKNWRFEIVEIGTMSDPNDENSFTLVEAFNNMDFVNDEIYVNFDQLTNDEHFAIRVKSVNDSYSRLSISNVTWELIPSCFAPVNVTLDNYSFDMANISWESNNQNSSNLSYTIEWKPETSSTWQIITSNVNATNYQLTSLTPNTKYQWRIKTNCDSENSRYINGANFKTLCNTSLTDFIEDFQTTTIGSIPDCWSAFTETIINDYNVAVYNENYISSKVVYCRSLVNDKVFLTTPKISNLNSSGYRLRFKVHTEYFPLTVGTLTTLFDSNTFTPVLTTEIFDNYKEYILYFDQITDEYIAFKGNYFKLDDVVWEPIPACIEPTNLNLNFIGQTDAHINWTNPINDSSTYIEWRSVCEDTWYNYTTNIGESSYVINNLNPSEEYLWRISSTCNVGNYILEDSFTTNCLSDINAPFTEYFNESTIPLCWHKKASKVSSNFQSFVNIFPTGQEIRFNISGVPANIYSELISTSYNTTSLSNPMLSFKYKKDTDGGSFKVYASTDGGLNYSEIIQNLPDENDWTLMIFDLTPYISDQLVIKFTALHDNTYTGIQLFTYIDDFQIMNNTLNVMNFTKDTFTYYPNPVKDILNISSVKPIEYIAIYNMIGQQIKKLKLISNHIEINTEPLIKGVYSIIIRIDGKQSSFKFIKK